MKRTCNEGNTLNATIIVSQSLADVRCIARYGFRPATTYRYFQSGRYAVIGCKLKQNANDGCNSCASLAGLRSAAQHCTPPAHHRR